MAGHPAPISSLTFSTRHHRAKRARPTQTIKLHWGLGKHLNLISLRFATFSGCAVRWISGRKYEAWSIGANTERNTEWLTAIQTEKASCRRGNPGRAATGSAAAQTRIRAL